MTTPTDRLVRQYWVSMVNAVRQYESHKADYEAIQKAYADRHVDPVTAKFKASGDPRSATATALATWYREEAAMYAAVITALRADEPIPAVIPGQRMGGI